MKKIITIDGMCCERCAKRAENALSAVSNVVSVDVKLKKKTAVIRSRTDVDDEEIKNSGKRFGLHCCVDRAEITKLQNL